jgi:hypothetical protein
LWVAFSIPSGSLSLGKYAVYSKFGLLVRINGK